ncbi:hypothetical protein Desti_5181 [Desulfomonile tiedjei DSM 6799]|uniref:Uncharacterized protein n=1 Tax=Desulfomonile tiedjei (strain ATCC 49306 / DSM 6799 / DCB-1) TaxID=706587 RepID=I4CDZ2_DESTA|nr:hypothetical protein Desti_5181 [Desulfomonile tiedjei DSM 6799]
MAICKSLRFLTFVAGATRLELATSSVTGREPRQSYQPHASIFQSFQAPSVRFGPSRSRLIPFGSPGPRTKSEHDFVPFDGQAIQWSVPVFTSSQLALVCPTRPF